MRVHANIGVWSVYEITESPRGRWELDATREDIERWQAAKRAHELAIFEINARIADAERESAA